MKKVFCVYLFDHDGHFEIEEAEPVGFDKKIRIDGANEYFYFTKINGERGAGLSKQVYESNINRAKSFLTKRMISSIKKDIKNSQKTLKMLESATKDVIVTA